MFPSKCKSAIFTTPFVILILSLAVVAQEGDRRINDDSGTSAQLEPAIAMNPYGQAVTVWCDNREGVYAVYAQMITYRGFPNKKNFKVSDDGDDCVAAEIAINDRAHFVVVWESRRDSLRIYAQKYANNGVRMGETVRVDARGRPLGTRSATPEVGIDAKGNYTVCWSDYSQNSGDILIQRFAADGSRRGANMTVNTITAGEQKEASMAMNADGAFVVAWSDDRLSSGGTTVLEIFAQVFQAWGQNIGGNFQVSHSPAGIFAYASACAIQPNGEFMICWNYLQNHQRIYAASYNAEGLELCKPVAVSDTLHHNTNTYPDICTIPPTTYAIAWKSNYAREIVLRYIDRLGVPGPGPAAISDVPGDETAVSLAAGRSGLLAVFVDDVNGNPDIYGTRNGSDAPLNAYAGSNFRNMVPLTWDPPYSTTDISRYRIQRREGSSPYADVAVVDLAARGPGGANMRDWIDTTVTAGHTYSYIVYPVKGDNPVPSVPVVATPLSSRPWIRACWAFDLPVIDGELGPGEWADACKVTLGNPFAPEPVILYLMYHRSADANRLYLAVDDPNDETIDPANAFGMLFDLNADGKWDAAGPGVEGMLVINSNGANFTGYWGSYPDHLGADAVKKAAGVESRISSTSGHVQYEVALDLETSPFRIGSASPRVAFFVVDPGNFYPTHYGNAGEWPLGALWECAETLGDLAFAISAVPVSALDWPMARKTRDQSAWAMAEHFLRPPFQYSYDYGEGLGVFDEMAVYRTMLFATAKDHWTVPDPWKVHAFDIPTGLLLWSYTLPGSSSWAAIHPAVNDSLVLVGDGGSQTLYALGRRTGQLRWSKHLPQLQYQDPIIDGDRVFIVSDSLYCLDIYTGGTIWHTAVDYSVAGILALDDTNVFHAGGDHLGSWDKNTGSCTWVKENNGQPSVMVDDEKLYAFHNDAFYFRLKEDGSHWWGTSFQNTYYEEESNVLAQTDSFVVVRDPAFNYEMGFMVVNKANSHIEWSKSFDSTYISPPTITDDLIFLRTWDDHKSVAVEKQSSLIAYDLWTGDVVSTIYDSAFASEPIVANGKLFIATTHSIRAYSNEKITHVDHEQAATPVAYAILGNYPNPFNPATTIRYQVEGPGRAALKIYNTRGQRVRTLFTERRAAPGTHETPWDGRDDAGRLLASGVYFARLEMEGGFHAIKVLLLK